MDLEKKRLALHLEEIEIDGQKAQEEELTQEERNSGKYSHITNSK